MFSVNWTEYALDGLADVWVKAEAGERTAIHVAARRIDYRLENGADTEGESRTLNQRILFVPPLAVLYDVNLAARKASVTNVWRLRRP